jgi:endoribonuclease Dicer
VIVPLTSDTKALEQKAKDLCDFERRVKYSFRDKLYLVQALTHASFSLDRSLTPDCYQRLEFLGDAILDFVVTQCLYSQNPHLSPGRLTNLRSALVNNNTFAMIAVKYGFHKNLQHGSPEWFTKIDNFVQKLKDEEEEGNSKV